MALVRRSAVAAVGRAQVPGAIPPPGIPHQGGVGVAPVPGVAAAGAQPGTVAPGYEMAAAVPSMPAKGWAVVTGGIDRNMGANVFVKFCKIGALSATGTRPYADGADGFVMGEGASVFLLKRLADAERDGDRIYAVVRSLAGSSDGKGKGITAPNPVGQRLAVQRRWPPSRPSGPPAAPPATTAST